MVTPRRHLGGVETKFIRLSQGHLVGPSNSCRFKICLFLD